MKDYTIKKETLTKICDEIRLGFGQDNEQYSPEIIPDKLDELFITPNTSILNCYANEDINRNDYVNIIPNFGTYDLSSLFTSIYDACRIDDNRLLVCGSHLDQDGEDNTSVVLLTLKENGTISNTAYMGFAYNTLQCKLLKLSDTKVLVVEKRSGASLKANIISVSGSSTSVGSIGSSYSFGGTGTVSNLCLAQLSDNRVAIHYGQSGSKITILSTNLSANTLTLVTTISLTQNCESIAVIGEDRIWTSAIVDDYYGQSCAVRCYQLVDTNLVQLDAYSPSDASSDERSNYDRLDTQIVAISNNRILLNVQVELNQQDYYLLTEVLEFNEDNQTINCIRSFTKAALYSSFVNAMTIDENKTLIECGNGKYVLFTHSFDQYSFSDPFSDQDQYDNFIVIPINAFEFVLIKSGQNLNVLYSCYISSDDNLHIENAPRGFLAKTISSRYNYECNGIAKTAGAFGELVPIYYGGNL